MCLNTEPALWLVFVLFCIFPHVTWVSSWYHAVKGRQLGKFTSRMSPIVCMSVCVHVLCPKRLHWINGDILSDFLKGESNNPQSGTCSGKDSNKNESTSGAHLRLKVNDRKAAQLMTTWQCESEGYEHVSEHVSVSLFEHRERQRERRMRN